MNIFKSFEIFLREPLSILRERIIQIVNVNSNLVTQASVNVDLLENKAQITIVNSEKMYKLCQTVMYKRKQQATPRLTTSQNKNQVVLGQMFGRT